MILGLQRSYYHDNISPHVLLSQTGKYALRASIHLAEQASDEPIPVGDIAAALDVPRNYLSKILHQLAREGVLVSERGPRGGFRLATSPDDLSVARVVSIVDPALLERKCLLGRQQCSDADPCPAHGTWQDLAQRIERFLSQTTVGDLMRQPDDVLLELPRASAAGGRR
jgi:Rrf2 family protein